MVNVHQAIPLHEADTIYLGGLDSEKLILREEEVRISHELTAAEAHLATLTTGLTEEMKQEATMKAAEERRRRILFVEDKLKSYVDPQA